MRRRFFPNFFGSRLWGDEGDDGLKTERSKRALDIDTLLFLLVGIFFFVGVAPRAVTTSIAVTVVSIDIIVLVYDGKNPKRWTRRFNARAVPGMFQIFQYRRSAAVRVKRVFNAPRGNIKEIVLVEIVSFISWKRKILDSRYSYSRSSATDTFVSLTVLHRANTLQSFSFELIQ